MREFISEYGIVILECVGCSIIVGLLFLFMFSGTFGEVISNFLKSIIGGV